MDELDNAAREYAVHASTAPDKETPDWIITDFKAGANWAQNNIESKSKNLLEMVIRNRNYIPIKLRRQIIDHLQLPF